MKVCAKCLKELPLENFYCKGASYYCKQCQRKVSAESYAANKTLHNASRAKRQGERAKWIRELKVARGGCVDCGYNEHHEALDFDHLPGFEKELKLSRGHKFSKAKVLKEMGKCELVCANCHRIRTATRRIATEFF